MTELVHLLVDALVMGAALQRTPAAFPPVVAAYNELKQRLGAYDATLDLSRIEARPESARGRDYLREDLQASGALHDPAVISAVAAFIDAIHSSASSAQAAQAIGVDIAQVRAAALQLLDITGEDVAVRLRDSTIDGTVTIRNAHGGAQSPTPGGATYILTGNQADKIIFGTDEQVDFVALEAHYLQGLYVECNELPLANDGPVDATRQRQPRLQQVYVDLHTATSGGLLVAYYRLRLTPEQIKLVEQVFAELNRDVVDAKLDAKGPIKIADGILIDDLKQIDQVLKIEEGTFSAVLTEQLSVLEAIHFNHQLVLLGDPGGGKSTLTRRLAGLLASQAVTNRDAVEATWLTELIQIWGRWLLPVRVVLSRWAQHLVAGSQGTAADLIDECVRLLSQTAEVHGIKEHFMTRLAANPPTALILLDGLDEVADESRRAPLLKAVKHFSERYTAVPLLITCRIRPWQAWTAAGSALSLPVFTIDKLTEEAISAFVERWHTELVWTGRYPAEAATAAQRRLLTAITNRRRPDLADMARTPLLLTMMARVNYERGLPDSRAELYEVYLRQLLWEWERQKLDDQGQPTSLQILLAQGNVDETSLERKLSQLAYEMHGSGAQETVDIMRSTVRDALEAIHPGRDEAKAAWAVAMLRLLDDRSGLLQSLDGATYQFSHRTFQEFLAARWLATGDFRKKYREKIDQEGWREAIALALGYQIRVLRQYEDALSVIFALFPKAATTPADWRRVLLLGEAYVRLLGPQRASESEQAELAAQLAERIPHQLTAAMQNRDLPPAQRLAAGQLLAALAIDPPGLDDFVTAPGWHFKIGRYPVTNKQFRRFVEAGGYQDDRWWKDEKGRQYRDKGNWTAPRFWHDQELNWPTQPVVGVSWYEAQAYCAWLTHELRQQGQLTKREAVRLPTQAEWETAARSHDGRDYPWGPTFDPANANTQESTLQQTTPVDLYPDGATPEGVWDLLGNVWEWSQDDRSFGKAICGGAFYTKTTTSAADDVGGLPGRGNPGYGFRCVVVHVYCEIQQRIWGATDFW